MFIKS